MAEHIEVARAFVTIVPSMEGSQAEISKELTGITGEASEKAGSEGGSKFGEKFAGAVKGASVAIGAALTAATGAAIATGKAFIDAAASTAELGDEIQKNAQKMNLSYEGYQELDYILSRNGSSIESMKSSMVKLAQAAESNNEAFQALGISQEQLATMNQEELFNATLEGLQNCTDESERMVLATQLLGKAAASELGPTLNMTAEETAALRQQVHDLGGIMSDEAVENAATFQDELLNVQTSLSGLKNNMMSQFLPGISSVMGGLAKVFSGDESGIGQIKTGITNVIDQVTALAPQFFALAETLILSLLEGFGPMLPQLATTIFSVLNQAILTVVTMLPQLMPAILSGIESIMTSLFECLPVITQSLFTLIMDLAVWLSDGNNITTFVNGIIDLVAMIASQMSEVLPVLLPAIVQIINEVTLCLLDPKNIGTILNAILQIAGAIFVALVNCVPKLIQFIVDLFSNIAGYGKDFGVKVGQFMGSLLSNVVNKVKELWTNVKNFFSEGFNNIKTKVTDGLNAIKNKFTSIFDNVKNTVRNAIDFVKGLFKFEWSLPKLKLPHLTVTGKLDLFAAPPQIPKVSVEWYRKAMDEPYFLEDPTIFGAANGKLLGGGEAGSELVVGTNKLMDMMKAAVGSRSVVINVYGAEGQDIRALAQEVSRELQNAINDKERVYA